MTGWMGGGNSTHQREKIFAILRTAIAGLTVYELTSKCWSSGDPLLSKIKPPTIRRCLQELRDDNPSLARKSIDRWYAFEKEVII